MAFKKIEFGKGLNFGKNAPKKGGHKVTYTDERNLENDSKQELTELQVKFKEAAKKEQQMKEENTDTAFWSCLVFQTREQRRQFFKVLGFDEAETDLDYVNGFKLAKQLQIKIDEFNVRNPGRFKCNKELLEISMDIKQ